MRTATYISAQVAAGRLVATGFVFCFSLFAATIFEASAKADIAARTARAAAAIEGRMRVTELTQAAKLIERSWARPAKWHGGANETLSWIYAQTASETGDNRGALEASAAAARRAVSLAPIQPASWARLATLAERGLPTPCTPVECLKHSWDSARFVDTQTGCARLRLAHRHGMLHPFDERVGWFARSTTHQRDVESCLAFLPSQEVFHALMLFTIQSAIWEESRGADVGEH